MLRRPPRRVGIVLAAWLAVVALGGCASPPQTAALMQAPAAAPARRVLLQHVPFFAQDDQQCGPAALAMVLGASGIPRTPAELAPQVFVPARGGSLQPELLAATRRHGRLAVVLPPQLAAVLETVDEGTPAVVLQNLGLSWWPVWHYAVLIGHDLAAGDVVLHSGREAAVRMPLAVFERTWVRAGSWAMVAVRPDRLPRTVASKALVAAAAALERIDRPAAGRAYDALVARDPTLGSAWFGRGNVALALGDPRRAAADFRRALELDEAAADAWNNLAVALRQLGDRPAARDAALRAVALGGPRAARYAETLREVEAGEPALE